jgi:hypothetical protein
MDTTGYQVDEIADRISGLFDRLMIFLLLVGSGVNMIALLALSDDGAPSFDHAIAAALSALGIPAFACTPDQFPDPIAAAISRRDVNQWAAAQGIEATRSKMGI